MEAFNRRSYSGTAPDTTLSADIDDATLTVTLADGTGWPDGSGGPFEVIFEPDTASEEKDWASARSGNTITLLARGMEGVALAHKGTTTVVRHGYSALDADEANYAVSQTVGMVAAKGDLLVGSGAHTLTNVTAGATGQVPAWQSDRSMAPQTVSLPGHTHAETDVTNLGADLAALSANLATETARAEAAEAVLSAALIPAWSAYTPAVTGSTGGALTVGNGTLTGRYTQIGKLVITTVQLTLGSTSVVSGMSGDLQIGLPVAPRAGAYAWCAADIGGRIGDGWENSTWPVAVLVGNVVKVRGQSQGSSPGYIQSPGGFAPTGSLDPASADSVGFTLTYEAA